MVFSHERHKLFGTSTEESYEAGSWIEEARVCRPSSRIGINYTLEKRRLRGDLIETFKIVTGRLKVKMEDFLNAAEVSTTSVVTSSR